MFANHMLLLSGYFILFPKLLQFAARAEKLDFLAMSDNRSAVILWKQVYRIVWAEK